MNTDVFTEEEAINITIQHGYDGSEFKTKVWKDRGCLSPNRTMDALISKLETIYHHVEVKGKGKKRKYILKNKKDIMTERKYNYKGTLPTKDDLTMKEFLFNHIVSKGTGKPKSYNRWGEEFKLFQPSSLSPESLIEVMKELHSGLMFNPKEIVAEFFNAIKNYNYALVHNSFRHLEKEERINQSSIYIFKTINGTLKEVSKDEYDYAMAFKRDLVESLGIDYRHYILSYRSFYKNEKMKRIIKEVDDQMAKELKINYMYEKIKISIVDNLVRKKITRESFEQSYFQKFIKLSKDRQNRKDYQDSKSFWRRTYLLNTLTLLSIVLKDKVEIKGLEELKLDEMRRKSREEFLDYYMLYQGEI